MRSVDAVFWDLDGTLADTEIGGHLFAFNKAFKDTGHNIYWDQNSYIELLKVHGGLNRLKYYFNRNDINISFDELQKIHKLKTLYYVDIVKSGLIPLRVGVRRLVDQLYRSDIAQYIVTTSSYDACLSIVNTSFNGGTPFLKLITAEHTKSLKPDPEAYNLAKQISGVESSNIIAIEDSKEGNDAANSAGIRTLVTLPPWTTEYTENNYKTASSVVNHLGDYYNKSKIFKGPINHSSMVNISYLQTLINL